MNEEIIQKLIKEAKHKIIEKLSSRDAEVLVVTFEQYLRSTLEKTYRRDKPKVDEIALRIGRTIIKEVSELLPENRLEHCQRELLDQKIGDLDRSSWDIAEKYISDETIIPVLQSQASKNLEKIQEIYRFLEQKGVDWQNRYGRTLSEATLDCQFVLGNHSQSSLRLSKILRFLQEQGKWPPYINSKEIPD